MDTSAGGVTHGPDEGLGAILGPVVGVVELSGVEHDLVHDLRDLDGVGGRAGATGLEGTRRGIRNVVLVVRGVEGLAVPASGESDGHTPATAAGLLGESGGVAASARSAAEGRLLVVVLASVAELAGDLLGVSVGSIADEHAEALIKLDLRLIHVNNSDINVLETYGLEGRDLVRSPVASDVVHGHASLDLSETKIGKDGNVLEGSIAGTEVEVGSPVVREILGERASRAGRVSGWVEAGGVHGSVERVTADDLVHMRSREGTGVDERVDAVQRELRASEAHQLLADSQLSGRKSDERLEHHLDLNVERENNLTLGGFDRSVRGAELREGKEGKRAREQPEPEEHRLGILHPYIA